MFFERTPPNADAVIRQYLHSSYSGAPCYVGVSFAYRVPGDLLIIAHSAIRVGTAVTFVAGYVLSLPSCADAPAVRVAQHATKMAPHRHSSHIIQRKSQRQLHNYNSVTGNGRTTRCTCTAIQQYS